MDHYSSGEELVIKTRKPYTITKQRERWTEDEHNRFLEALKLYGRAWQRIEEHIGTKTAVQIRSHAQKFFTKLEKEAHVKGVPASQALDIEIPPPRPKRKPNNPYPRKTSVGNPTSHVAENNGKSVAPASSLNSSKHVLDLEKDPCPEKPGDDIKLGNARKDQDEEYCPKGSSSLQLSTCTSLQTANEKLISAPIETTNRCTLRQFIPILGEDTNREETGKSCINIVPEQKLNRDDTDETFQDNATSKTSNYQKIDREDTEETTRDNAASKTSKFENSHASIEYTAQFQKADDCIQPSDLSPLSTTDMQSLQNCPRHVPVHIVDGDQRMDTDNCFSKDTCQKSTLNQIGDVHSSHPLFTPVPENLDDYRSHQASSAFYNLIISSLLQNPAAHAAASYAATFWPRGNLEGSSTGAGFPCGHLNSSTPSMAAIAGATVAAATAWWAAHGLIPFCTPFQAGFTSNPTFGPFAQLIGNNQGRMSNSGSQNNPGGVLGSKDLDADHSEDSEESGERKIYAESSTVETKKGAAFCEIQDSSKTKMRKQVDRSSCGSNTSSSSDIETDALQKDEKSNEEIREPDASNPSNDPSNRRCRSSITQNDSWKEVSEEGRLAFQALFSREVLPQSFSPPHDLENELLQKAQPRERTVVGSCLDLSSSKLSMSSSSQLTENTFSSKVSERHGDGLLTMELGNVKLKSHRTGFKPYKRCSVEAKGNTTVSTSCSQNDEKVAKRIRLEGKAST